MEKPKEEKTSLPKTIYATFLNQITIKKYKRRPHETSKKYCN